MSLLDLEEALTAPIPPEHLIDVSTSEPLYTAADVQAAVEAAIASLPTTP
jgi:hypothetical protein